MEDGFQLLFVSPGIANQREMVLLLWEASRVGSGFNSSRGRDRLWETLGSVGSWFSSSRGRDQVDDLTHGSTRDLRGRTGRRVRFLGFLSKTMRRPGAMDAGGIKIVEKMMRLQTYAGFSLVGAIAVIYHAFSSRGQFYPAMVYLSTSKISLVLLMNMGLVMMCIMWQLTKFLFLGSLREAEVERLNEQTWREVMEILFAITIFRQDFSVSFLAMVTALLLIKALHWLAQKRVEYIETTPSLPMLSHVRIVSFLGFLLVLDSLFLYSSLRYLIQTWQPSVSLFFSFEYMILATTTLATFVKYIFYVSDMLMEGQWERKAVYTFYLELIRDLLHLSMYIFFFLVIFMTYGVPLHLIRELYETFRNFKVRFADFIRYRKITSNMNDRFPDATPEELNASDVTCIICREEMVTAKKLICGHLFHVHCLRSWLERQHTCPTCRALVVPSENGAPPTGVSHGGHAEASQHVPNGAGSSSQGGGEGNTAGDNLSQHQARLEAAAAAASLYEKSYVYPSGNAFVWSPGYTILPQMFMPAATMGHGESVNLTGETSASEQAHEHQSLFPTEYSNNGLPQTSSYASAPLQMANPSSTSTERSFGDPLASGSSIEAQERFLQCQIEILQSQLQLLRIQQKPEGLKVGVNDGVIPSTSESKGKAVIADSSVSDCGHHGDSEGVDTN